MKTILSCYENSLSTIPAIRREVSAIDAETIAAMLASPMRVFGLVTVSAGSFETPGRSITVEFVTDDDVDTIDVALVGLRAFVANLPVQS